MKLPGSDRAVIEPAKIRDYLLSSAHPVGRFKATFFRSLGYMPADFERLEADLRELAESAEAVAGKESKYGRKYEVRGIINRSLGKQAHVVTVWIIKAGEDFPRFVTAFPGVPA